MPKLIINKLGPVETCELECSQFMNFTGFQASGKSTIAKAIYYFRTIKDDILGRIKLLNQDKPVVKINWKGQEGKNTIESIFESIINIICDEN